MRQVIAKNPVALRRVVLIFGPLQRGDSANVSPHSYPQPWDAFVNVVQSLGFCQYGDAYE
jgi:hypothetical protein